MNDDDVDTCLPISCKMRNLASQLTEDLSGPKGLQGPEQGEVPLGQEQSGYASGQEQTQTLLGEENDESLLIEEQDDLVCDLLEDDPLTEEVTSSYDGCTISTASDLNPLPPSINVFWATVHLILLIIVFCLSTALMVCIWYMAPRLGDGEPITIPTDLAHLRHLADVLHKYKDDHFGYSLLIFCSAYVWKQTYAIPGSLLLNLIAGALFGMWIGTGLVNILTAIGSSCCYLLSSLFARPLVQKCLWKQTLMIKAKIHENRSHLVLFLLSARTFPFTPHWLLNISFPFVGIPIYLHFFTMSLGMLPYHFVCIRAGRILSEIKSVADIFNVATLAQLIAIAIVFVAIGIISKRLRREQRLPHLVTD